MTMSFLLRGDFEEVEPVEIRTPDPAVVDAVRRSYPVVASSRKGKYRIPDVGQIFHRKRLIDLVNMSVEQYGATLISGRAGTGKTILAADFARRQPKAVWFSIEASDAAWPEFAMAFSEALRVKLGGLKRSMSESPDSEKVSSFLTRCFGSTGRRSRGLYVLDNVHHLFDAAWFPDFFRQMIVVLDPQTHLLMLCRSRPSAPLWRLRSKQMLNVIDEPIINLTRPEAREICADRGLSEAVADEAFDLAFGNIAKLAKILDGLSLRSARGPGI
jgi:ATP/maltotriose-dependent transcriptional regulator MalT